MTIYIILCLISTAVMLGVAHAAYEIGFTRGHRQGFSDGVLGERYSAFDPMAARIDEIEDLVRKARDVR